MELQLFFITEQQLVDQAKNIHKRGWLTEIEFEEIERKIELDNGNKIDNDPDNVTPQETNTTTMSEEEPSIEQVDKIMAYNGVLTPQQKKKPQNR